METTPGPLLIGIPGTALDDECRRQLSHPAVGGVVLFTRNFRDRDQLISLVDEIHAVRTPRLLVCIDQEGGRVQRLQDGFTRLPALGILGRLNDSDPVKALDMAYRHGRVMATEMLDCGIDLSFAPVLDLDRGSSVIGDRSFSPDPGVVATLGASYLAGMHDAGMRTTGKHFPGHGSILADSHTDDAVDSRSLDEIRRTDLEPFRALAPHLDALMIAHVVYPAVDPLPAGYSRTWLRDILRSGMGYGGTVFSDDLGMHAAKSVGSLRDRTRLCLEAGCDLVLVCHPEDVTALLAELGGDALDRPGTAAAISRLYGKATVSRAELASLRAEGIKELAHWKKSLQALGCNMRV
jgi:beta-N-acetylhexosaminidase